MAETRSREPPTDPQRRRRLLPPELVELFTPPLTVGAAAGGLGLVYGAGVGIVKDYPPALSAATSGIKWFTLGSSFWLSRSVVVKAWGGEEVLSKADKTKASAIAGGAAGLVGTLLRARKNVVSAVVVFSLLGGAGQAVVNAIRPRKTASGDEGSWLRSEWSPLRKLTDDEYRELIGEKRLKVQVDIALIEDKIASLRGGTGSGSAEGPAAEADGPGSTDRK